MKTTLNFWSLPFEESFSGKGVKAEQKIGSYTVCVFACEDYPETPMSYSTASPSKYLTYDAFKVKIVDDENNAELSANKIANTSGNKVFKRHQIDAILRGVINLLPRVDIDESNYHTQRGYLTKAYEYERDMYVTRNLEIDQIVSRLVEAGIKDGDYKFIDRKVYEVEEEWYTAGESHVYRGTIYQKCSSLILTPKRCNEETGAIERSGYRIEREDNLFKSGIMPTRRGYTAARIVEQISLLNNAAERARNSYIKRAFHIMNAEDTLREAMPTAEIEVGKDQREVTVKFPSGSYIVLQPVTTPSGGSVSDLFRKVREYDAKRETIEELADRFASQE